MKFSISCRVNTATPQEEMKTVWDRFANVFDKFLHQGSVRFRSAKQVVSANRSAFVNMFHVPTKEYTNNALQYVAYRKLQPPVYLPPIDNHVTVL